MIFIKLLIYFIMIIDLDSRLDTGKNYLFQFKL